MNPYFSIIIPTYNRAHLISATIKSVLDQKYDNFELIIVNDGSTDNTEEMILQFNSEKIRYYKIENSERGYARNYGAKRAKGKYFNFFDSDDLMYPNHLIEAYKQITNQKGIDFLHLMYEIQNDEGIIEKLDYTRFVYMKNELPYDNILSCNSVFLSRSVALEYPFNEDRNLSSSEDWELWIRLFFRYSLICTENVTSVIINHDARSLKTINADRVVARDLLLISSLSRDSLVFNGYGNRFKEFVADRYTYFMLMYSLERKIIPLLYWSFRAILVWIFVVRRRRFWASLLGFIYRPIRESINKWKI